MLFADGAAGLILLGLWLFCLIDVITTNESNMRNLPKVAWVLIVLILFDIGSLLWLIAGRNWHSGSRRASSATAAGRSYPEYDRPGRYVPTNPEDDEAFLRQLRERAEDQRRSYDERRRAELQDEQDRLTKPPSDEDPRPN